MTDRLPDDVYAKLARAAGDADPPSTDQEIAILAVASGKVTEEQVAEARAEQERRIAGGGKAEPLGRILVQAGYVREAHVREWMRFRTPLVPVPQLEFGTSFGKYVILGLLGRGGMGIVYRAHDPDRKREVALKVLRYGGEPSLRERMDREARTLAKLAHPGLVSVHETGAVGDTPYIVMDLIPGESLSHRLPLLGQKDRALVLEKVARAVGYAHARGVLHRDLKPGNIMVRPDGEPVVMDFGLARAMEGDATLTATGAIAGTPFYMAPEQIEGRAALAGPWTDVSALGVILYEMLCERLPYDAQSVPALIARMATGDPVAPHHMLPHVPRDLSAICMRALEKDPKRRYRMATDLADELRRWREGTPVAATAGARADQIRRLVRRHRLKLVVGALCLVAIVVPVVVLLPPWIRARRALAAEREEGAKREAALKELGGLWMGVALARKELYQAQADPARVRERLRTAIGQLTEFLGRYPERPQAWFARGRAHLSLGDADAAEGDLSRAVAIDSAFTPAWALLAQCQLEQVAQAVDDEEYRAAGLQFEDATQALRMMSGAAPQELNPAHWGLMRDDDDAVFETVWRALQAVYVADNLARARSMLVEALEARPSEEYCLWLARWEDEPDRKLEWLDRAIQIMPHSARAHLERGNVLASRKDAVGASQAYSRALRVEPGMTRAHVNRAILRTRVGDFAGALADARAVTALAPASPEGWALLGFLHLGLAEHAAAQEAMTKALALDPRNAVFQTHRGVARHRQGQLAGALEDYDQALRVDNACVPAYYHRGLLRHERGEHSQALGDLSKALDLQPRLVKAYLARARVKAAMNDAEGAKDDRRHAKEIDPDAEDP